MKNRKLKTKSKFKKALVLIMRKPSRVFISIMTDIVQIIFFQKLRLVHAN